MRQYLILTVVALVLSVASVTFGAAPRHGPPCSVQATAAMTANYTATTPTAPTIAAPPKAALATIPTTTPLTSTATPAIELGGTDATLTHLEIGLISGGAKVYRKDGGRALAPTLRRSGAVTRALATGAEERNCRDTGDRSVPAAQAGQLDMIATFST